MDTQKKIEKNVVAGYKAIEDGVVSGYKAIENSFVSGYKKIENKFVQTFLDGAGAETVAKDEAKAGAPEDQ